MAFADDYIAQLAPHAAGLPRVKTLHLPPLEAADSKDGEFCAVELSDGSLGVSYVLLDDTLRRLMARRDTLGVAGADAMTLARAYAEGSGVHRTLGFAAANAITRHVFDRLGYTPPDSTDSIGALAPGPGDHIGMIGFFGPLAERIVATGARLSVVELKSELAGERNGYRVTTDSVALQSCNKVLSTSTILLNDTLDRMLSLCVRAEQLAMIGPGAGCPPDALFARGVTLLGGSWIVERDGFVDALCSGQGWSRFARKTAISTVDYPGWNTLWGKVSR